MNYHFEKHINIVKRYEVTHIKPLMPYQELVQIRQKQKTPTKCFMCENHFNDNDMIFLGFMKGKVNNQLFCAACAANIKSTLDEQYTLINH